MTDKNRPGTEALSLEDLLAIKAHLLSDAMWCAGPGGWKDRPDEVMRHWQLSEAVIAWVLAT